MMIEDFAPLRGFEAKEFIIRLNDYDLREIFYQIESVKKDIHIKYLMLKKEINKRNTAYLA